jgi:CBS domain-containing protein
MTVQDLMTRDVKTCQQTDPLSVPAELMWTNDCGAIPVVDSDMRVVGMITDRDIAMATYLQQAAPGFVSVSTAMSPVVHSCRPDDSVEAAERIMRTRQVHRLPVTELDGRLVGILSLNDIARATAREKRPRERQVSAEQLTTTLAAICEPRQSRMAVPTA